MKKVALSLLLLHFYTSAFACEYTVKVPKLESSKDFLIYSLLELSVAKLNEKICFKINDDVITDGREIIHVDHKILDLIWSSAASEAEKVLVPIRIPIFKGLLGYRIFVIRNNEQERFDGITSLEQLKNFYAGQGAFWGDTKVLEAVDLNVIKVTQARNLWQMLNKKRFDYLPIAVNEPWKDLEIRPELELTVEKNILLMYPSALYFYTHTENNKLRDLISTGMKAALADGSYDRILGQSRMIELTKKYANLPNRKVILIENKHFHDNTPKENIQYWLTPETLTEFLNKN